jgi:3alpha(or 20beta)-hydroxysteroid dehydrogenase
MNRLDDKTVLITGAAKGLGEAIVRLFVAGGATVIATDTDEAGLKALGPEVITRHLDVSSERDWADVVGGLRDVAPPISVLVNNAAICEPAPLELESLEHFMQVALVNQAGVFLGIREIAPIMRAQVRRWSTTRRSTAPTGRPSSARSRLAVSRRGREDRVVPCVGRQFVLERFGLRR